MKAVICPDKASISGSPPPWKLRRDLQVSMASPLPPRKDQPCVDPICGRWPRVACWGSHIARIRDQYSMGLRKLTGNVVARSSQTHSYLISAKEISLGRRNPQFNPSIRLLLHGTNPLSSRSPYWTVQNPHQSRTNIGNPLKHLKCATRVESLQGERSPWFWSRILW